MRHHRTRAAAAAGLTVAALAGASSFLAASASTALAELEDALRDRHELTGSTVPPYLQAAIDREHAILAELHRRSVAESAETVSPTAEPTPA